MNAQNPHGMQAGRQINHNNNFWYFPNSPINGRSSSKSKGSYNGIHSILWVFPTLTHIIGLNCSGDHNNYMQIYILMSKESFAFKVILSKKWLKSYLLQKECFAWVKVDLDWMHLFNNMTFSTNAELFFCTGE